MSVWDILTTYYPAFLTGLRVTLQLCLVIWTGGLILGSALALAGVKFPKGVGLPSRGFSFFLGGVPLIVFLFFAYSLLSVPKMIYLTGFQFEGPPWGIIRTALESFLLVVIFWAGFRGGDRLDKLKKAATSPNPPALL